MATIWDYRGIASLLDVLGAIAIKRKEIEDIKRTLHDALNESHVNLPVILPFKTFFFKQESSRHISQKLFPNDLGVPLTTSRYKWDSTERIVSGEVLVLLIEINKMKSILTAMAYLTFNWEIFISSSNGSFASFFPWKSWKMATCMVKPGWSFLKHCWGRFDS